jgi:hypothetical protein
MAYTLKDEDDDDDDDDDIKKPAVRAWSSFNLRRIVIVNKVMKLRVP